MKPSQQGLPQIALCTTDFGPGGITRTIEILARELPDAGFAPLLILMAQPQNKARLQQTGIPWRYVRPESTLDYVTHILGNAGLLHLHSPFEPLITESAVAMGIPITETIHTLTAWQYFPFLELSVCVSKAVQQRQPFPERTVVIGNGVDLPSRQQFNASLKRREQRWGKSPLVLVESGRPDRERLIPTEEILAELLAELPDARCLILGREGRRGGGITGTLRELPIEYLGWQEDPTVALKDADLLIHLPSSEAFGLAVAEAMAWGVVPVTTLVGGLSELVRDGADGYLISTSDRQAMIAEVVRRVVEFSILRPERRSAMAIEARRRVEMMFSVGEMVSQYAALYNELIHRRRASAPASTGDPKAGVFLDCAQKALSAGDMLKAIRQIVEGVRVGGRRSQFYELLGRVYLRWGLIGQGIGCFRVSTFLEPSNERIRKTLALALVKYGRTIDAKRVLQKVEGERLKAQG